jgi:hypothetical protein
MRKTITLFLTTIFMMLATQSQAQVCAQADATVSVLVTNVVNNSVTFTYSVKNNGSATLYLNRMYFQTYISANSTYDASDLPSGGSIFSNNTIALTYGQVYSGSWTSNAVGGSITGKPYLLYQLKVRSGYSMPECNTTNNNIVYYYGCNIADFDVTSLSFTNVDLVNNRVTYNYTIKNLGWGPADLSKMYYQTYVSRDAVFDATDVAAGGSIFFSPAPGVLSHNQTYSSSASSGPAQAVSIRDYKYLVFQVKVYSGTLNECNTANNQEIRIIPLPAATALSANLRASYDSENHSLVMTSDDEENKPVQYRITKVDGQSFEFSSEGTFTVSQEISLPGLAPGMYIVNFTNGTETQSHKFVVVE